MDEKTIFEKEFETEYKGKFIDLDFEEEQDKAVEALNKIKDGEE